tara:strand:- start:187 stop:405 length:219 start_codon:yes stop_codon:yes gene_type:complete
VLYIWKSKLETNKNIVLFLFLKNTLSDKGHIIKIENYDNNFGFGGAQIIRNLGSNFFIAGSDPLKDGQAVRY